MSKPSASIMVIDDDPFNLAIIEECLTSPEYRLELVEDSRVAWDRLCAPDNHYDLLLLDQMMPGLTGLDMLRMMKQTPQLANIPVILQTAAASPQQIKVGIEAGATRYLTKPYLPQALREIVAEVLAATMNV
jgi:CheY-like chemotaxis protein